MKNLLIIITGASGTGKSSIIPFLQKKLPKTYFIYDFDELGESFDGTDTWKDIHLENMIELVKDNQSRDMHTVICGLICPQWIDSKVFSNLGICVHYILLTVTKLQRKIRLERRNAQLELIEDEEELNRFPKWMDKYTQSFHIIDTSALSLPEISSRIVNLIIDNS